MDDVKKLIAIEQIKIVKAKYFRAVDTKDLQLLRSVFATDVTLDARGAATDPGTGVNAVSDVTEIVLSGIEEVLDACARGMKTMTSVHQGFMPEIEITGEASATAIWPMFDIVRFPAGRVSEMTGYGHYYETYERLDGLWRIKTILLKRLRLDIALRA